jgi:hypothetical protein
VPEQVPLEQVVHAELPVFGAKVPAGQVLQVLWPVPDWNVPGWHGLHVQLHTC